MADPEHVESREEEPTPTTKTRKAKKETDPGIAYLSRIPKGMNVKKVRQIMSEYGEVGRLFLQPNGKCFAFSYYRSHSALT